MKRDPVTLDAIKNTAAGRLESNKHLFEVGKKKEKRSKYNNVKVEFDNYSFDSQHECSVYIGLRMRLRAKEISDLRLQVPYELNEGGSHSYKYIADFTFIENGIEQIWDAKGFRTSVYKKKAKLMLKVFGITIIEV